MEEWRSGDYRKKERMERYQIPERTFWYTIKGYADAKEPDLKVYSPALYEVS